MQAGVSKTDQDDKNRALAVAAGSGSLDSVRLLISYGADPNADLRTQVQMSHPDRHSYEMNGADSVLIDAVYSGHPEVVEEILKYHPNLEARGFQQRTALFFTGEHSGSGKGAEAAVVECARLLLKAGANVNARDYGGNTPLHEVYVTAVEKELLRFGANVNARNNEGETPIFTNIDDDCVALFVASGADLTIRNKRGQTVVESAKHEAGPHRQDVLREAIRRAKAK